MSINRVNITGNLTRDPELRATAAGTQVLSFGIAVNDRRKNPQTEVDPKSWTVENEIGTGRKHSEEKLFRVLFCLGK